MLLQLMIIDINVGKLISDGVGDGSVLWEREDDQEILFWHASSHPCSELKLFKSCECQSKSKGVGH